MINFYKTTITTLGIAAVAAAVAAVAAGTAPRSGEEVYLVGDATPTGWSLEDAKAMPCDEDGVYSTVSELKHNDSGDAYGFKFAKTRSSFENSNFYLASDAENSDYTWVTDGSDEGSKDVKWSVPYTADYKVELKTGDGSWVHVTPQLDSKVSISLEGNALGNSENDALAPVEGENRQQAVFHVVTGHEYTVSVNGNEAGTYGEETDGFYRIVAEGTFLTNSNRLGVQLRRELVDELVLAGTGIWKRGEDGSYTNSDAHLYEPGTYVFTSGSDAVRTFTVGEKDYYYVTVTAAGEVELKAGSPYLDCWGVDGDEVWSGGRMEMEYDSSTGEYYRKDFDIPEGGLVKVVYKGVKYGCDDTYSEMYGNRWYGTSAQEDVGHDLKPALPGKYEVRYNPATGRVRLVDGTLRLIGDAVSASWNDSDESCLLTYNPATGCYEAWDVPFNSNGYSNRYKLLYDGKRWGGELTVGAGGDFRTLAESPNDGSDIVSDYDGKAHVYVRIAGGVPQIRIAGATDCYGVSAHMPLKPSDFEGNRSHYFLVGPRTSGWRLQPEWELLPQSDGSYKVGERLLYNGYYMIARVDSYEDYVMQRYTAWSAPGAEIDPRTSDRANVELSAVSANTADGKFLLTRYNDIASTDPSRLHGGSWDRVRSDCMLILSSDLESRDGDNMQSLPSVVEGMSMTVDGEGNPGTLTLSGISTDLGTIATRRTFTLCGDYIRNDRLRQDETRNTPLNFGRISRDEYWTNNWADAWLQYDAGGEAYYNGYGEYVYQTVFTYAWLSAHPAVFNAREGNDNFSFTSNDIIFRYDPESKHDTRFGDKEGEKLRTYVGDGYSDSHSGNGADIEQNLNDYIELETGNQACYRVERMWMKGDFRIWSGWSGNATNWEDMDNGTFYTRWYLENASSGAPDSRRALYYQHDNDNLFALFRDVPQADFGVGYGIVDNGELDEDARPQWTYYDAVEVWYDIRNGFNKPSQHTGSMICFKEQGGSPTIAITNNERISGTKQFHLYYDYGYQLPGVEHGEAADMGMYGDVTSYRIYRCKLTDGVPLPVDPDADDLAGDAFVLVDSGEQARSAVSASPADFAGKGVKDTPVDEGTYRYYLELDRRHSNGSTKTQKAWSNIVTLRISTDVEEVMSADGGGRVRVYSIDGRLVSDSETRWVEMDRLPAGVYVVCAGNGTKTVIKK